MKSLPAWVGATLQDRLEHVSRRDLRERARAISDAYRADRSSVIVRSDLDAMAYALVRMPATYAAVVAAVEKAAAVVPDLSPLSILDVGSGPGTATLACLDVWPGARRVTLLDCNDRLLDLAAALMESRGDRIAATDVVRGRAPAALADRAGADIVVASYALTEIGSPDVEAVLSNLWRLAEKLLVIVEPGTPRGFSRILQYRDALLSKGARIVAPCSHDDVCPLVSDPRWCHFSARLPRSRDHLAVKEGSVPYEDERYAYLVAAKDVGPLARGRRILATPKVTKASVSLTLCAPNAPAELSIPVSDKAAFKSAKRYAWGDSTDF